MNQWVQVLKKALGVKDKIPAYVPFGEPEWKDYSDNPYRVIYLLQMNEGIDKATLYEFLTQEWMPALSNARGCTGVEIVHDFAPGSGYVLLEFWETKAVHDQAIRNLWHGTHTHVLAKLRELSEFAFLWEGIVVERAVK